MTTLNTVSDKLTLLEVRREDDETTCTDYECNVEVQLAGDSIWDCTLDTVTIKSIHIAETVYADDGYTSIHIAVCYDVNGVDGTEVEDSWRIYTDSGFEEAVSELLGEDVSFTEQGMQEDGVASMEN